MNEIYLIVVNRNKFYQGTYARSGESFLSVGINRPFVYKTKKGAFYKQSTITRDYSNEWNIGEIITLNECDVDKVIDNDNWREEVDFEIVEND